MALKSFNDSNSDEARQFLLDRRDERNHPKRHRTNKRRKALSRKKRSAMKHKAALQETARKKFQAAAYAYWRGERSDHP